MSVSLVTVTRRGDEDISVMLKRFSRKVSTSNHIQELKDRRYFVKPSLKKREEMNAVLYKQKKNRKSQLIREGLTPKQLKERGF
ncbi:MAG: Ribosomal protein [Bacteroidota bacterium]|jgi:ribosomal protein S21